MWAGCWGAWLVSSALGQSVPIRHDSIKLTPPGTDQTGARFGKSVSVSGGIAVVGAPGDDERGFAAGAAYIYRQMGTDWELEQKLTASDAMEETAFGTAVATTGELVVVGAPRDGANGFASGSVYVFRWDGSSWLEEQKLVPADGAPNEQFGRSVAASGDVIVVGAFADDDNGVFAGSAYVFRWNGTSWRQEQKLLASDGDNGDWFGWSVAVSGDALAVGAAFKSDESLNAGAVYVFQWKVAAWVQVQKLFLLDAQDNDRFGWSVAMMGDVLLVGRPTDPAFSTVPGAVHVLLGNGSLWMEEQMLVPSDGEPGDTFGWSVAIDTNVVVAGSPRHRADDLDSGAAYAFHWDGSSWTQEEKLLAWDRNASDFFGESVGIADEVAFIGGSQIDDVAPDAGAVYGMMFCDSDFDGVCDEDDRCPDTQDSVIVTPSGCPVPEGGCCRGDATCADGFLRKDCEALGFRFLGEGISCGDQDEDGHIDCADGCPLDRAKTDPGRCGCGHADQSFDPMVLQPLNAIFGKVHNDLFLSGDTFWVGEGAETEDGTYITARAYRWNGSTWSLEGNLETQDFVMSVPSGPPPRRALFLDGDTALVGVTEDGANGPDAGAVFFFRRGPNGWEEVQKLMASDGREGDQFGAAVTMSGDIAFVGAPASDALDQGSGAVYVLERTENTWVERGKLIPPDGASGDAFGDALALSADTLFVGAPYHDTAESNSGAVYIFRQTTDFWALDETITNPNDARSAFFGQSLDVFADLLVVGSGNNAYVFRRNATAWAFEQQLTAPNEDVHGFGQSVATSGGLIAVFANQDRNHVGAPEAVYVFQWTGLFWVEIAEFLPPGDPYAADFNPPVALFGSPVAAIYTIIYSLTEDVASPVVFAVPSRGDADGDGDVDLRDCAALMRCFTGDDGTTPWACRGLDVDQCRGVNVDDHRLFLKRLTGPQR